MVEEKSEIPISNDEAILQQQFRRAVSSFEGIVLSLGCYMGLSIN